MGSSSNGFDEARKLLGRCQQGSDIMHRCLEELVSRLEQPQTRHANCQLLHELVNLAKHSTERGQPAQPFSVVQLELPGHSLQLIQLPSVFAPERWSFTFYEGLSRMPRSEFEGRTLSELGCGNGWISMALAHIGQARKVYGLDINPRAILSAKLNAHLNASRPDGSLITDSAGLSLIDRVEFHVSDLLAWCRNRNIVLDRIVGCIPQVLDPQLETNEEDAAQQSDQFLYALSNYCGRQGYVEDQFGLGLMARVLEESIETMAPGGKVIFNLGGRPGRRLLRNLFERRGYQVGEVWRTRAPQAEDTDIGTLVEIETRTDHRFEFFLSLQSEEPVGARTAAAYAAKGGDIFHSIDVFEGQLRHAAEVKSIFRVLKDPAFAEAHEAVDLAFEDEAIAEEKLSFLADLCEWLSQPVSFPYGETAGLVEFRELISKYLMSYFRAPLSPHAVFVTPTRTSALVSLLLTHRPRQALIDRELAALLPQRPLRRNAGVRQSLIPMMSGWSEGVILEAPRNLELCCQLLEKLRPGLLVIALTTPESQSLDALENLIETARQTQTALVLDISAGFELSSTPPQHATLRMLADGPLPDHVSILCGLVKDNVYRDLELGLLITENASLLRSLRSVAELSYSRPPLLVQRYYERILRDLLSFRIQDTKLTARPPRPPSDQPASKPPIEHASLHGASLSLPNTPLRLDYGENTLPAPTCLRAALLEAFVRRAFEDQELDVRPELCSLLEQRFGVQDVAPDSIHIAGGVAPLFTTLMQACAAEGKRLLLPRGSYGYFAGGAELAGLSLQSIETFRDNRFKVTPAELAAALAQATEPAWLYLNAPVVNPTGAIYSAEELAELLELAHKANATVVLDTVFAGLEAPDSLDAERVPRFLEAVPPGMQLAVLGGISKELAAGGLRFGWGYTSTEQLSRALACSSAAFGEPHPTLRFAVKRTLQQLLQSNGQVHQELLHQRTLLAERSRRLCDTLEACGWDPIRPQGGLFVVARPVRYEGRSLRIEASQGTHTYPLQGAHLAEALLATTGLLINDPAWTGIPHYYRFVVSVEEDVFEAALDAIRRFDQLVAAEGRDGGPADGGVQRAQPL